MTGMPTDSDDIDGGGSGGAVSGARGGNSEAYPYIIGPYQLILVREIC